MTEQHILLKIFAARSGVPIDQIKADAKKGYLSLLSFADKEYIYYNRYARLYELSHGALSNLKKTGRGVRIFEIGGIKVKYRQRQHLHVFTCEMPDGNVYYIENENKELGRQAAKEFCLEHQPKGRKAPTTFEGLSVVLTFTYSELNDLLTILPNASRYSRIRNKLTKKIKESIEKKKLKGGKSRWNVRNI